MSSDGNDHSLVPTGLINQKQKFEWQEAEIARLRDTVEHYKADAAHDEALINRLKAALEALYRAHYMHPFELQKAMDVAHKIIDEDQKWVADLIGLKRTRAMLAMVAYCGRSLAVALAMGNSILTTNIRWRTEQCASWCMEIRHRHIIMPPTLAAIDSVLIPLICLGKPDQQINWTGTRMADHSLVGAEGYRKSKS
jgi:hypothetical protein